MPSTPTYKPPDWLKGSTKIGQKYTAWNDYGQGTPDFGAGYGPGTPYHEVTKSVPHPPRSTVPPQVGRAAQGLSGPPSTNMHSGQIGMGDPRINIIRRRLGWV